ncbi:AMP-binding protein [Streptomyces sp. NPDC051561]|uniref:non-ribosomal peptide synthetase n=1 Tax=Streptomyces sp. NPDC051561 TaxID=3365658 RepID=UPI0037B5C12E
MTTPALPPHMMSWLEAPPAEHSLRFSDGHGTWTSYSYKAMAEQVRRNAHRLHREGIGSGDVVLLLGQNTIGFVTSLFGILHAGATPAIVAPVAPDMTVSRLKSVIDSVGPAALLATADHAPILEGVARSIGLRVLAESTDGPMDDSGPEQPEAALIQFSSGSTSDPRGVQIPWSALNTHVFGIHEWLSIDEDSRVVSWLPFYHDMGLVGCLLMPLAIGGSASFMPPQEFIGHPLRWLREISESGGTACAIAAFSLSHILRRVRPEQLEGLDLSSMRSMIIGAERIAPDVLSAFHQLLAPTGLAHDALLPAYGLAEATLAVTGIRPDSDEIHTQLVDTSTLEIGKSVPFHAAESPSAARLVSCGRPLTGIGVDILDADGGPLPEGTFGEIAVRGYSLATGYRKGGLTAFGDRHATGDMGFVVDNELYVVGRAGDSVKQNGRPLFAEDVQVMAAAVSPKPQRTVALLGALSGANAAVIVVEDCTEGEACVVGSSVASRLPGLRVIVLLVPHGTLQRTTSGKPRRRAMWQELVMSDDTASRTVWDSLDPSVRSADRSTANLRISSDAVEERNPLKRADIVEQIRVALCSALGREVTELSETTSLFEDLAVDSSSVLELLLTLEELVGLEIDPEALEPEIFETVGSLADYVESDLAKTTRV